MPKQLLMFRGQRVRASLLHLVRSSWFAWVFWPALAWAVIVSGDDVANAVLKSQYANAFLKANAAQIGALSSKVENRSGDTTIYNGSCCYGVLQLNTSNILAAGYTVSQYRYGSLQTQVDAWSRMISNALADPVIKKLASMGTFDGKPVDAAMLLSCVQLGQGNCRTMITSGRCSGFADRNGTTICSMAASIRSAISGGSGGGGGGGGGGSDGSGSGTQSGYQYTSTDPYEAFTTGAGIDAPAVADAIKVIVAALFVTWLAWATKGTWSRFIGGAAESWDTWSILARATVVVLLVIALLH